MSEETKKRSPLGGFVHHQVRAAEETGKAFASLLPNGFRRHMDSAIKETRTGLEYLVDGIIETVEDGVDALRSSRTAEDETDKDKVKVDVE